jgi:MFS family permease
MCPPSQFLMVLDQAVMNVSITQLVEDFGTNVTTIQGVITMYSLVMATLMLTGGKVRDIIFDGAPSLSGTSSTPPGRRAPPDPGACRHSWSVGRSSKTSAPRSCSPRWSL